MTLPPVWLETPVVWASWMQHGCTEIIETCWQAKPQPNKTRNHQPPHCSKLDRKKSSTTFIFSKNHGSQLAKALYMVPCFDGSQNLKNTPQWEVASPKCATLSQGCYPSPRVFPTVCWWSPLSRVHGFLVVPSFKGYPSAKVICAIYCLDALEWVLMLIWTNSFASSFASFKAFTASKTTFFNLSSLLSSPFARWFFTVFKAAPNSLRDASFSFSAALVRYPHFLTLFRASS